MKLIKSNSGEKGAAILEGALALLTLFLLIFSIWEAGRLFNVQNVVTNAAREGARFSAAPTSQTSTLPTEAEVVARVQEFLRSAHIIVADDAITVNQSFQCDPGDPACNPDVVFTSVTVAVPYSFLELPLFGDALNVTLIGNALMRNETSTET